MKKETTACRSENAKGEKDAVETVLTLLKTNLGSEETSGGVLQPLLQSKVEGILGSEELTIVCGVVKTKVRGTIGCLLLPGLKTTSAIEISCAVNASHDPVTGKCVQECGATALEATLNGTTYEDAWEEILLKGTANHSIFIDD